MVDVTRKNGSFSVKAYRGDAKTLLAFNLAKAGRRTWRASRSSASRMDRRRTTSTTSSSSRSPPTTRRIATEPANSSINAPIHKFRWLHVPGSVHQGLKPFFGKYTYTVTPRYFDEKRSMLPLDPALSASVRLTSSRS